MAYPVTALDTEASMFSTSNLVSDSQNVVKIEDVQEQEILPSQLLNTHINNSNIDSQISTVVPSQRKLKRQKKLEERLKMKAELKLQRKLKNKQRKSRKIQLISCVEKRKKTSMADSSNEINVVIDFSYNELMSAKDLIKCGNQAVRCYSANRRSSNPIQLHFCLFTGKILEEMSKCYEFKNWDIHFHENSYLDIFEKENLVYLTSESKNVLETLEGKKVYIIGGLVDHNAHKGVSYRKAVQEGISHVQLPIKKHIQMKTRAVLTINHVFDVLLNVSNGESWSSALKGAIPQRFFGNNVEPMKSEEKKLSDDVNASNNVEYTPAASTNNKTQVTSAR